jgi:hypothetical protein
MGLQMYRILFEIVNPIAHPDAYEYRGKPKITIAEVPEDWWEPVERQSTDFESIQKQMDGCQTLIGEGELIRNPRIEQTALAWEPVTFENAAV